MVKEEELTELSSDYEIDEVSDITFSDKVLKHSKTFIISSIIVFLLLSVGSLVFYFMDYPEEGLEFYGNTPEEVITLTIIAAKNINHYFELIGIISAITFGCLLIFFIIGNVLSISEYITYTVCMLTILAISITIIIFESRIVPLLRVINKNVRSFQYSWRNNFKIDPVTTSHVIIGITLTALMITFSFGFLVSYLKLGYMHYNDNM